MVTNYHYEKKEIGYTNKKVGPQNWSGLPEGEKIHLLPEPELPHSATKVGDDMIVYGPGGSALDKNHEVNLSEDPIAGEKRKVKMRCP